MLVAALCHTPRMYQDLGACRYCALDSAVMLSSPTRLQLGRVSSFRATSPLFGLSALCQAQTEPHRIPESRVSPTWAAHSKKSTVA